MPSWRQRTDGSAAATRHAGGEALLRVEMDGTTAGAAARWTTTEPPLGAPTGETPCTLSSAHVTVLTEPPVGSQSGRSPQTPRARRHLLVVLSDARQQGAQRGLRRGHWGGGGGGRADRSGGRPQLSLSEEITAVSTRDGSHTTATLQYTARHPHTSADVIWCTVFTVRILCCYGGCVSMQT